MYCCSWFVFFGQIDLKFINATIASSEEILLLSLLFQQLLFPVKSDSSLGPADTAADYHDQEDRQ